VEKREHVLQWRIDLFRVGYLVGAEERGHNECDGRLIVDMRV
jgi:hypothetical protein